MNAPTLLRDLQARGFDLRPEGENIRIEPFATLTDADRAAIRKHKPALLQLLAPPILCVFHPRRAYDPEAARAHALTETGEVRAALLGYAAEANGSPLQTTPFMPSEHGAQSGADSDDCNLFTLPVVADDNVSTLPAASGGAL